METITCQSVQKRWGRTLALNDFHLQLPAGELMGLLGPNGAGKTTAIRLLTGLASPSAGHLRVLGLDPWREWPSLRLRVGVLIDAKFPPYLTPLQQLQMVCQVAGWPRSEAGVWLEAVGLTQAAHKKIGAFSFGMAQRLGLAQAMMGKPEVLILDEPLVGLDPAGIVDLKARLRELARSGTAILFSSHQLKDVEELCDRVTFIESGKVKLEGRVANLRAVSGYRIRVSDAAAAVVVLNQTGIQHTTSGGDMIQIAQVSEEALAATVQRLVTNGIGVLHVEPIRQGLEQLFTGGSDELVAASRS